MDNFLKKFIIFSVIIFLMIGSLILAVDPYEKYGFNLFGFKTKAVMFGREIKYIMVDNSKINYETFLLGSSSAHRFLSKDLKEITGYESFNYAVQHATVEDYLAQTRHVISRYKPKIILIQYDFYTLNNFFKVDPRLYNSQLKNYLHNNSNSYFNNTNEINAYLTLDAIRDTFRVIGVNLFSNPKHTYLKHGDYPIEKEVVGKVELSQSGYGKYEISTRRVEMMKKIQQLCVKNEIELIAFTSPRSIEHIESMKSQGLSNKLAEFKKTLSKVHGKVYDFTNDSSKDYSLSKFFLNSSHPTTLLSKEMLRKIFQKETSIKNSQFGHVWE